ncbi:MAG: hypothetical protein ACI4HQ_14870 [Acetatifactor sp.]
MKNKVMNQKVLKAISIGLSAMMAMTPMTAMAEELDNAGENGAGSEKLQQTQTPAEKAEAVEKAAGALVAEADEEAGTADGAVTEAAKAEEEAVKSAEDTTVEAEAGTVEVEVSQDVKDAAGELEKVTKDGAADADENDAEEIICDTEDVLSDAKDAAQKQTEATETAEEKVQQVEDITAGFETEMKDAAAQLDENQKEIENADTLQAAEDAKAEAENTVAAAEVAYEAAKAAVETAEADYTKAAEDAKAAAEKYNEAVADAEGYTEEALEELRAAKEAAAKLEQEAKKAYDDAKLGEVDAAALAIINKEKEVQSGNQKDWTKWKERDELFCLILNNYYVPNCMPEGTQVTLTNGSDVDDAFLKFKDDDGKNFIMANITYPDGTTEVKYYNYKLDKEDKASLVIFEKTWEEMVTQEAEAAKYVVYDEESKIAHTIYADDLEQAIENNEVVKGTDDKYYVKAKNEDGTTVAGSTNVAVDEETNIVDEESKEITWSVDENGNIVKTVTGDVTTVTTIEGVSLDGGSGYATEEAARAAAKKEAEDKLGENETLADTDVEVSRDIDSATAEAAATVTYVTTFTTTIDLTGMTNKVNAITSQASGKKDSVNDIKNDAIENAREYLEDNDCKVLSTNVSNLQVTCTENNKYIWQQDTYTATSGTLTVTYAKISTATVDISIKDQIRDLINKGHSKEKAMQLVLGADQILDINYFNWDFQTSKVEYIQQQKLNVNASATDKTDDAAKAAAEKAAEEKAMAELQKAATAEIDAKITNGLSKEVTGKNGKATTTAKVVDSTKTNGSVAVVANASDDVEYAYSYSYTGTYDAEKEVTENMVLSTETWEADQLEYVAAVEEIRENVLTNANYDAYLKGDQNAIMLAERTDENFLKFKADALNAQAKLDATKAKYTEIQNKAIAAQKAVAEAEEQVKALQEQIKALEKANADLTDLENRLEAAKLRFSDAEKDYEELEKKLEEIEKEYEDAEKRLTPAPVTPNPVTPTPDGEVVVPNEPVLGGIEQNFAVTPLVPNNGDEGDTIEIEEEETPLAPGVDEEIETVDNEVKNVADNQEAEELISIGDESTALAGSVEEMEEAKSRMNWWWLLIVAVLGAAGYEMYRKYEQKKEAAQKSEVK